MPRSGDVGGLEVQFVLEDAPEQAVWAVGMNSPPRVGEYVAWPTDGNMQRYKVERVTYEFGTSATVEQRPCKERAVVLVSLIP